MSRRFNPPPGWPRPPRGWLPEPGWSPPPSAPPIPDGWQLIIDDDTGTEKPPDDGRENKGLSWKAIGTFIVGAATIVGTAVTIYQVRQEKEPKKPDAIASIAASGPGATFCDDWADVRRQVGTTTELVGQQTGAPPGIANAYNELILLADRVAANPPPEVRTDAQTFSRATRMLDQFLAERGYITEDLTTADRDRYFRLASEVNGASMRMEIYYRSHC